MTGADRLQRAVAALFETTSEERVGIEVEALPVASDGGTPVPPIDLLDLVRSRALREGWVESTNYAGAPAFRTLSDGVLTFEPGGQLEYATAPFRRLSMLEDDLRRTLEPIAGDLAAAGVRLLARGIDPRTPVHETRLHLNGERYRRMTKHLSRKGESGPRMMRQTAALHINIDAPGPALEGWRAATAVTPALLALFANSPMLDGVATGHRSVRSAQWRTLDPSRTGLIALGADPVSEYRDFARGAESFLLGGEEEPARPFREWLEVATDTDIDNHLSTLFPEVRPRGYLEVRALDALPLRWVILPTALLAGVLFDPLARRRAASLSPADTLLERAGRCGLADPGVAGFASEVFDLAEDGLSRLDSSVVPTSIRDRVAHFRSEVTARALDPGAAPGDDLIG